MHTRIFFTTTDSLTEIEKSCTTKIIIFYHSSLYTRSIADSWPMNRKLIWTDFHLLILGFAVLILWLHRFGCTPNAPYFKLHTDFSPVRNLFQPTWSSAQSSVQLYFSYPRGFCHEFTFDPYSNVYFLVLKSLPFGFYCFDPIALFVVSLVYSCKPATNASYSYAFLIFWQAFATFEKQRHFSSKFRPKEPCLLKIFLEMETKRGWMPLWKCFIPRTFPHLCKQIRDEMNE